MIYPCGKLHTLSTVEIEFLRYNTYTYDLIRAMCHKIILYTPNTLYTYRFSKTVLYDRCAINNNI